MPARTAQHIVALIENWWDKYRVTLTAIEQQRDAASVNLRSYVKTLGYA
jgi:type I restriction enzyme M protein